MVYDRCLFDVAAHRRVLSLSWQTPTPWRWGLLLFFAALVLWGQSHHELWRDELQPWLLVRDSQSWRSLWAHLQYEAIFPAWPALLKLLQNISVGPMALQLLSAIIGIMSFALIVFHSPFSLIQKSLLGLNAFFLYQCTLLSQPFGLGILGLTLAVTLDPVRLKYPRSLGLALAISSASSLPALSLSTGLALLYGSEVENPHRWKIIRIFAVGACLGLGFLSKAGDYFKPGAPDFYVSWDYERLALLFSSVVEAFIPIPWAMGSMWRSSWINQFVHFDVAGILWGATLLCVTVALFRYRKTIARSYLTAVILVLVSLYLFSVDIYMARGFIFYSFLLSCWLYESRRRSPQAPGGDKAAQKRLFRHPAMRTLFHATLALQAAAGFILLKEDIVKPFSHGSTAAKFIKTIDPASTLVAAGPDYTAPSIAGHLEAPLYFPQGQRWGTFTRWDKTRIEFFDFGEFARRAGQQAEQRRLRRTVLVLNRKLTVDELSKVAVNPLAEFENAIVPDENFYFYDLLPQRSYQALSH